MKDTKKVETTEEDPAEDDDESMDTSTHHDDHEDNDEPSPSTCSYDVADDESTTFYDVGDNNPTAESRDNEEDSISVTDEELGVSFLENSSQDSDSEIESTETPRATLSEGKASVETSILKINVDDDNMYGKVKTKLAQALVLFLRTMNWKLAEAVPTEYEEEKMNDSGENLPDDEKVLRSFVVWRRSTLAFYVPLILVSTILSIASNAEKHRNEGDVLNKLGVFARVVSPIIASCIKLLGGAYAAWQWARVRRSQRIFQITLLLGIFFELWPAFVKFEYLIDDSDFKLRVGQTYNENLPDKENIQAYFAEYYDDDDLLQQIDYYYENYDVNIPTFEELSPREVSQLVARLEDGIRVTLSGQNVLLWIPILLAIPNGAIRGALNAFGLVEGSVLPGCAILFFVPVTLVIIFTILSVIVQYSGNWCLAIAVSFLTVAKCTFWYYAGLFYTGSVKGVVENFVMLKHLVANLFGLLFLIIWLFVTKVDEGVTVFQLLDQIVGFNATAFLSFFHGYFTNFFGYALFFTDIVLGATIAAEGEEKCKDLKGFLWRDRGALRWL